VRVKVKVRIMVAPHLVQLIQAGFGVCAVEALLYCRAPVNLSGIL
jgi:hypothetical protein